MTSTILSGITGVFDSLFRDVWTGTLDMLRGVLALVGPLGQIDPSPGGGNISTALWSSMVQLALLVAVLLFFAQLAMAVLNPRRNMLTAVVGPVQYGVATAVTAGIVVALLGAADGLTSTILQRGAGVTDASVALDGMGITAGPDEVKAVVLALLGTVAVVPLAIGYGIMLLFRSATILVLIVTLPIVSAGLVNLATKHWFWRATRWLLALIFLQPTFALVFSLGTGIVSHAGNPAAPGHQDGSHTGVVSLLLGLAILFVALFAPMGLFRLFAFVEPGTMPHQTMMSAFSSAVDGFKQAGSGIANADIGSVFSAATGGRFGASGGDGSGGDGSGGNRSGGGSSADGDDKQQMAAAAGLAVATGGASAAAGAGGAEAAGASGAMTGGGTTTAAASPSGSSPTPGTPGAGPGSGGAGGSGGPADDAPAAGAEPVAAPTGGPGGRSAGGGGGGGGSGGGGGLGGAGSAAGSAAGTWGAAEGIAGHGPIAAAPHGGLGGGVRGAAPAGYGGARPVGGRGANPYRDPSYDRPHSGGSGGGYGGGGFGPGDDHDDEPPDDDLEDDYDDSYDDSYDDEDDDGSGHFAGVM